MGREHKQSTLQDVCCRLSAIMSFVPGEMQRKNMSHAWIWREENRKSWRHDTLIGLSKMWNVELKLTVLFYRQAIYGASCVTETVFLSLRQFFYPIESFSGLATVSLSYRRFFYLRDSFHNVYLLSNRRFYPWKFLTPHVFLFLWKFNLSMYVSSKQFFYRQQRFNILESFYVL